MDVKAANNYREQLMATLNGGALVDQGDLYNALMGKEQDTLKLLNRVVNYDANDKTNAASFFSMSLADIGIDYVASLSSMIGKLLRAGSLTEFVTYVKSDNRYILYIGATFVIIAVLLLLTG